MTSDKRFQVFVSSTFRDLKEERQAIQRAVLELGHMPAGMELFPATDESAWDLIKTVIDESDYYVLVVGGMYGSMHPDGLSFTEMEYDYAYSKGKPVIAHLHKNPASIPRDRTETDSEQWERLEKFRAKVSPRHTCQFWDSVHELKSNLIVSLTATIKRKPAIGWVRADTVPTQARLEEVLRLQARVADLESQLATSAVNPISGAEGLSQGKETHTVQGTRIRTLTHHFDDYEFFVSWDEIFGLIGPALYNECTDESLRSALLDALRSTALAVFTEDEEIATDMKNDPKFAIIETKEIDTFLIQFRALGLIAESQRKRSISDSSRYWALTKYGDHRLNQLRAIRKAD